MHYHGLRRLTPFELGDCRAPGAYWPIVRLTSLSTFPYDSTSALAPSPNGLVVQSIEPIRRLRIRILGSGPFEHA